MGSRVQALATSASGGKDDKESLVSTWELVSQTETNDKGEVKDMFGSLGFLTYTAEGRTSAVSTRSDRQPLTIPQSFGSIRAFSAEERAEDVSTFVADLEKLHKVIHHIEVASVPNMSIRIRYAP